MSSHLCRSASTPRPIIPMNGSQPRALSRRKEFQRLYESISTVGDSAVDESEISERARSSLRLPSGGGCRDPVRIAPAAVGILSGPLPPPRTTGFYSEHGPPRAGHE